jgi:CHAT domain-containing protein
MRLGSWALILLATWWLSSAWAGPQHAPAPPKPASPASTPSKADRDELAKLQTEATQLEAKQAFTDAIKTSRKVVELQTKLHGKDSREVYYAQQSLASLLSRAGDYGESLKIYRELELLAAKQHGPESHEVIYALQAELGPLWSTTRLDDIIAIQQRVLEITKKVDGENSFEYSQQLTSYAGTLFNHNEYSQAMLLYEQALQILEKLPPGKAITLQGTLQTMGSFYWQLNMKPKAMAMFDRAIKLAESAPDKSPMTLGSTLWSVAATYHFGGRDDLAKPVIERALDVFDKEIARLEKDKPDDYQIPSMLGMSAYMLQQIGDLPRAADRMQKAIAIDEKARGYSGWSVMLAELYHQQGKYNEALAILQKSADWLAKMSPQSATGYNLSIALVLKDMGDYKRAEKLMLDHLASAAKTYGRRHPIYGMTALQLAFVYMAAGDLANAERTLDEALSISEKELQLVLKTGNDNDHAIYFQRNGYLLDSAINFNVRFSPKSAGVTRLALTTLLRRKGRLLDASAAALSTIRAKLSLEDKRLLDQLADARAKLAKLTVAGPGAGDPDAYAKQISELEDQVEKLEVQIGKKSAAYRVASTPIELASIQRLIPRDARLIEVVNYQPWDPTKPFVPNTPLAPRHYAAYVVATTGDPVMVDLGDAQAIDDAVEKFRKAVADPDNDRASELGHALYTLTMGKIMPTLRGATNILIAPDGTLNVVPFSALVDDKNEFLIKRLTFTYLTSGRDLMRLAIKTKAQGGGVIFADPSFDSTKDAAKPNPGATSRGQRSLDLASLSWPRLPGTGKEADAVAKTWRGLKVFRGSAATESAVKAVHGPKILHLATHGFFLPDEPPPPVGNDNRGATGASAALPTTTAGGFGPPATSGHENPLLRSGLALAGANQLESGDEDGILTALEASGLDLEGTKLVVLSACETGVGKVTNGDGVYGLRRALVIAGAESLVMSLWQVDDEATKELMVGYYGRLATGKSRSSALREIQLQLLARDKYKHPYYWASFLPAGDNSPIKE